MTLFRLVFMATLLLVSGCSFQQTLNSLVEPVRQREIVELARQLCTRPAAQRSRFDPAIWAQSEPRLSQIASQCPTGDGVNWRLTTFRFNLANNADGSSNRQEYAVVVEGGKRGPWTETEINFGQVDGGPLYITGWAVRRLVDRPVSLTFIDNWDKNRSYGIAGGITFVALIGALVLWLIRRRRRSGKRLTDA